MLNVQTLIDLLILFGINDLGYLTLAPQTSQCEKIITTAMNNNVEVYLTLRD